MAASLPDELWLEIFSIAVHVPGLLATKWDSAPDEQMWEGWKRRAIPKGSLATRRAIVHVSREWWRIGRRFLYEALDLWKPDASAEKVRGLENLAVLFEQSGKSMVWSEGNGDNSHTSRGYGWWATRIEIGLQWLQTGTFPSFLRLVSACHNIRIVMVHGDTRDADLSLLPQLTEILQSRFLHSLRRLSYWFPNTPFGDNAELLNLPNVPLDSATLCLSRFPAPSTNVILPSLALSTLSSLEILIPYDIDHPLKATNLPAWPLPALRYLYISGLLDHYIQDIFPFMEVNGPQLLGLRLEGSPDCCEHLHKLLEYTAVPSFVLDDYDFRLFQPENDTAYSSVTHIGLSSVSRSVNLNDSLIITGVLKHILPRQLFPHLRTMRILEERVPAVIDKYWWKPIDLAAEYGVRLEDRQCRLLSDSEAIQAEPSLGGEVASVELSGCSTDVRFVQI